MRSLCNAAFDCCTQSPFEVPASPSRPPTLRRSHEWHREAIQHVRLPPGPLDLRDERTRATAWTSHRPPDRRYNVQCAESWKQRIAKEQLHNAPVYLPGGDDDDDAASVLTVSSIRSSRTGNSVSTAMALEKIEALQKKLEEEQRRREAVEKELARLSELTKSAGAQ